MAVPTQTRRGCSVAGEFEADSTQARAQAHSRDPQEIQDASMCCRPSQVTNTSKPAGISKLSWTSQHGIDLLALELQQLWVRFYMSSLHEQHVNWWGSERLHQAEVDGQVSLVPQAWTAADGERVLALHALIETGFCSSAGGG